MSRVTEVVMKVIGIAVSIIIIIVMVAHCGHISCFNGGKQRMQPVS